MFFVKVGVAYCKLYPVIDAYLALFILAILFLHTASVISLQNILM